MRRVFLLLAVVAVVSVVVSGFALAVTKSGGDGDNRIEGTRKSDRLSGGGGDDRIFGKRGNDNLFGDPGNDRLFAEEGGNDFINAIDEREDPVIDCGPGETDEAYVDFDEDFERDNVAANCEVVFAASAEPTAAAEGTAGAEELGRVTPETITPEQRAALVRVR